MTKSEFENLSEEEQVEVFIQLLEDLANAYLSKVKE